MYAKISPSGCLPGIVASQIALFVLALFVAADYLLPGARPQALYTGGSFLFILILFGSFLLWGTIIGILEQLLFRFVRLFERDVQGARRPIVYLLSLAILAIAPLWPLLKILMVQRNSLVDWPVYLTAAVLSAVAAAIALKILLNRSSNPVRVLFAAVVASIFFFLAVRGTSLFLAMGDRFKPIQLKFYFACWWGSIFSLGLVSLIGHLRERLAKGRPEKISALLKFGSFAACPILAFGFFWLDSTILVGLYGGAHLFLRIVVYMLLDLFALTIIVTVNFSTKRRRGASVIFCFFIAVTIAALITSFCLDLRPSVSDRMFLEGTLTWPVANIGPVVGKILGRKKEGSGLAGIGQSRPRGTPPEPALSNIPRPEVPRVFLIFIDALRADHLSCCGYNRETSSNIDRFAKEAVLFRYCIAPGSNTAQSFPVIWTSRIPQHLVMTAPPDWRLNLDNHPKLAEVLKEHGFHTMGLGSLLPAYWGYSKGFQDWVNCPDKSILRRARAKGATIQKGKVFLYIHYMDLHNMSTSTYREDKNPRYKKLSFGPSVIDRYDTVIKLIDEEFGELMDYLKSENIYDNSIIMITSDHGAGLGEHGYFGHSRGFYNGEVLIPLIVKAPGCRKGRVISETVGTIDLFPTILDLVGIEKIVGLEGRSLVPLMYGKDSTVEPGRIYLHVINRREIAVIRDGHKLIQPGNPRNRLYAFKDDPLEKKNLIRDLPEIAAELKKESEEMTRENMIMKPLPAAEVEKDDLKPGLIRKLFNNPYFDGNPVSESVVLEDLRPQWDLAGTPPPKEGFSIQWDGYIYIPDTKWKHRGIRFGAKSRSEIEMWIDGVKLMDATYPRRAHSAGYWESNIPLGPGLHDWRIRLTEKRNPRTRMELVYFPHFKEKPIPPDAIYHKP